MKNLRKVLVFVLFALATVFAFGLNSVKADDSVYSYTFASSQFSAFGSKDLGGFTWTAAGDSSYFGYDSQNGRGQQFGSSKAPCTTLTLSTESVPGIVKEIKISTAGASSTNAKLTVTVGGVQYGSQTSLTSGNKEYTFTGSSTGEIKFAYTQTSKKALYIKAITITYELSGSATILDAPENVAINEGVISWDAVEGAAGYKVSFDGKVVAESIAETSFDLDALGFYGTHEVSIVALGDGESTLDSQATLYEYFHKYTFVYETKYAYINYDEIYANAKASSTQTFVGKVYIKEVYNDYYGNFYVMDEEGNEFIVYGLYSFDGSTRYNAMAAADKPVAGDEIVVKGQVSLYDSKGQFKDAHLVQLNGRSFETACSVGFQTANTEEGQHVRIIAGLNVDYNELEALSFTITDAEGNERVVEVEKVFGTLVANSEAGVVEVTAESQGFESLFAVTVTNVPAGTTLYVTATYKTASTTYTTVAKAIEVK